MTHLLNFNLFALNAGFRLIWCVSVVFSGISVWYSDLGLINTVTLVAWTQHYTKHIRNVWVCVDQIWGTAAWQRKQTTHQLSWDFDSNVAKSWLVHRYNVHDITFFCEFYQFKPVGGAQLNTKNQSIKDPLRLRKQFLQLLNKLCNNVHNTRLLDVRC